MGVKTENKMAYEPVNKLIIQMSAPPLISMFFQYSYNLVDSMFVAGINEQALAAVSLAFPITTLMNALSVWIGVGVNVLIAGYLGQKNQQKANSAAALGVVISVVVGVLINFLSLFIINPYYSAFTQNKEIFEYGIAYMSVCVFMQIPNMVHIVIQKILQATGNMIAPMWFQIAGVVFNFVFDPLLIFGIGPFPKMGVVGAAVATVLGYVVSTIIALIQLFLTKQKVKPVFKNCLEPQMIKLIFSYGLPSFVMNALGAFTVNFANMFLVRYSDTAVAFFGAYFKVQQLIFMTVNGLIQGCLPIMRFNYRAKEYGRLKQANKSGTIIATVMMIVGMLLVLIFPKEILFLFLFFLFIFDNKNCRHNGDCSHKTRDRKPYVLIVACLYRTGIVLSFLFAGCRRNFSFLFNSHVDRYFPEFFRNCDSFFCLKCSCQFICSCFVCFIHICVPYD